MPSIALLGVGLFLVAAAPWAVHALEAALQRRLQRRTLALLARALPGRRRPGEPETPELGGEDERPQGRGGQTEAGTSRKP
jgi:hypothetical protein